MSGDEENKVTVNESKPKEEQHVIVDELITKEPLKVNEASLSAMEINQYTDVMTADQRAAWEQEQENKNKNNPSAPVKNEGSKNKTHERDIDKIKEDDINNYMYNDWLIASANWGLKKSLYGFDIMMDKLDRTITNGGSSIKGNDNHDTTNFAKTLEKWCVDDYNEMKKNPAKPTRHLQETISNIRNGEWEKLGSSLSDETIKKLQEMEETKRKETFSEEREKQALENLTDLVAMSERFGATYATADRMTAKINGEAVAEANNEKKAYELKRKEGTEAFIQYAENLMAAHDKDIGKKLDTMLKEATKARENASKTISKGNYKENKGEGFKGYTNKHLKNIDDTMSDAQSQASNDKKLPLSKAFSNKPLSNEDLDILIKNAEALGSIGALNLDHKKRKEVFGKRKKDLKKQTEKEDEQTEKEDGKEKKDTKKPLKKRDTGNNM
jgi:hypothetical protein